MILKYISFLIGLTWSYSLIKTQSIFSKKAGLIFKLFISKVSWLTFLAAVYFGYKSFTIEYTLIGIVFSIIFYYFFKPGPPDPGPGHCCWPWPLFSAKTCPERLPVEGLYKPRSNNHRFKCKKSNKTKQKIIVLDQFFLSFPPWLQNFAFFDIRFPSLVKVECFSNVDRTVTNIQTNYVNKTIEIRQCRRVFRSSSTVHSIFPSLQDCTLYFLSPQNCTL